MDRILDRPVGAPRLENVARAGDRVTVVVSDKTRLCRTHEFLPPVLARLERAGVRREDITLLFATGTHPPQTEDERQNILGASLYADYRVEEHDCRDESRLVDVGRTLAGTPVRVNRRLAEADLCVATGAIVHHYFAGFGGGAKLFIPGCAAYDTAVANHRLTLRDDGSFHPACTDGVLDGNPVVEDIRDAMRFLPRRYYVGVVLDPQGGLHDAVCGDIIEAHRAGARMVDDLYRVGVSHAVDCCIASAGGHPKDINFIQSHKTLHHASYAVREGGCIIALAACPEGIGNPSFLDWFTGGDEASLRRRVLAGYTMNAHTAVALQEKTSRFGVILVSGLDGAIVRRMGMIPAATLQEAVDIAAGRLRGTPEVLILENGALMVPFRPEKTPPQPSEVQ
jgi:nickel-dependent lactate racemase